MKRLLDTSSADEASESARRLLSSVDPLPRSAARKRHVWNAMAQRATGRPRFGAFLLAPAVLLIGASSLAAYDGAWPNSWDKMLAWTQTESDEPTAAAPREPTAPRTSVPRAPDAALVRDEPESDEAAPTTETSLLNEAPSKRSESKRVTHRSSSPPARAKAPPTEDESQLLVEALQARRSGDHARAERLAEQYSRAAPRGALAEEALIVALEAAVARRDPRAEGLAQSYLEQHPRGRFRARAQRALVESRR